MSFTPAIPLGGVPGWALLQRIEPGQRSAFARRPDVTREGAYFAAKIAEADTPAKLVADRRLLSVALGAFGLEDEIDKRALIRRVLESDPADRESFANRLVDPRYKALATAFGYANASGPKIDNPGFAAKITTAWRDRQFEAAVGDRDSTLRLALNARREIAAYAASSDPNGAAWFSVLGDRPVREVIEKAFGLPTDFGKLDVDRQRDELRARTRTAFGDSSLAVFKDPAKLETLVRRYIAREGVTGAASFATPGATALTLLGGGGALGAQATGNLFQSRLV